MEPRANLASVSGAPRSARDTNSFWLVVKRRAENAALAVCLVAIALVTFCGIAVLRFEFGADANILTADDAMWGAFATIATVSYGDRYPNDG